MVKVSFFPFNALIQGDDGLELPALEHGDSMIAVNITTFTCTTLRATLVILVMLALGKLDALTTPSLGDQFKLAPRTATSASIFAGPKLNYPLFNTILVIRVI